MAGGSAFLKSSWSLQTAHVKISKVLKGGHEGGAWSLWTETGDYLQISGAIITPAGVLSRSMEQLKK